MTDNEKHKKLNFQKKILSYDTSNIMAKELKIEDWGEPYEVVKMAEMKITKSDQKGTKAALERIRKTGKIKNNNDETLFAALSGESIKKLLNGDWTVAANIDQLFANAIEPWKFEFKPNKDNRDLKERKYLYSPINSAGKIVPVKITVFVYKKPENGTRIYSGEIIDHEIK